MIIWRGWGIVALLAVLGIPAGLGIWQATGAHPAIMGGICVILFSAGVWWIGQQLNVVGPQKRVAEFAATREAELNRFVSEGTFNLGPGQPLPQSYEQARSWANDLLAAEKSELLANLRNRHTFFFIPVQYFAFISAAGGLLGVILGIVNLISGR